MSGTGYLTYNYYRRTMNTANVPGLFERLDGGGALPTGADRGIAVAALIMISIAAATVAWRRLAGALIEPLPTAALVTAGLLTALAAAIVRIQWFRELHGTGRWANRVVMIATSLSAAVLIAGLCLPGSPPLGIAVAGLLLAAEECWAWAYRFRSVITSRGLTAPGETIRRANAFRGLLAPGYCAADAALSDAAPAEEVTQQLVRGRAADGSEVLSGWLRTYFTAGQRTGSVHVAICPPLDGPPEVSAEQIDGPPSRVRTAQALPYGVRLDLKLAAAAEGPTGVLLRFSAASARKG